jgi:MFS family permease
MQQIDRNIIALGWVSFFTDMASSMVTTLLPIFVVYVLDEGVDKLGYIIAIATFTSYALRIFFGYLSDRYQIVKPFVAGGYLISAVTKPLLMFSHSYGSVAALRTLERMGKAVRSASKDSLISQYSQSGKAGKSFGFHKMMDVAGEMSGALIIVAVFYLGKENEAWMRDIFGWTLLPGLIAVVIMLFFVKDAPKKSKQNKSVINKDDYHLFWILGGYFAFAFFMMSEQYFILRARETGFTLFEIPLLVIASTLTQILLSYYSGTLIDRVGSSAMLFVSYLFGLMSLLAIKFGLIWLSFVFLGVFTVVSLNALRAYISANAISQAFVYGILYGGIAISSSLGALVVGEIWHRWGFGSVVLFSLIGMSVMSVALIPMIRKGKNAEQ